MDADARRRARNLGLLLYILSLTVGGLNNFFLFGFAFRYQFIDNFSRILFKRGEPGLHT
jgi:hypothetical protein